MSSIQIREILNNYYSSNNVKDLIEKVLKNPLEESRITDGVRIKVTKILNRFLKENRNQIISDDYNSLQKLKWVASQLAVQSDVPSRNRDRKHIKSLEKTISELTSKILLDVEKVENDLVESLNPESEWSLLNVLTVADEYLSFPDLINLRVLGRVVDFNVMINSAFKMSKTEFDEFFDDLWMRCYSDSDSDCEKFEKIVNVFFTSAPLDVQTEFFSKITDADFLVHIIPHLPPALVSLDLSQCPCLNNDHIKIIVNSMYQLECLHLNCSLLSDEAIEIIAKNPKMNNLKGLFLYETFGITDDSARAIADSPYLANLINLHLPRCNITDAGVLALSRSSYLINLRDLNLSGCMVCDPGIQAIAESPYMNLGMLNLTGCNQITDVGLRAISDSERMENLVNLILNGCYQLTDDSLSAIANSNHLKKIILLYCSGCYNFTDLGIVALVSSPHIRLTSLDLSGCVGITDESISFLSKSENMCNLESLALGISTLLEEDIDEGDVLGEEAVYEEGAVDEGDALYEEEAVDEGDAPGEGEFVVEEDAPGEEEFVVEGGALMNHSMLTDGAVESLSRSKHLPKLKVLSITGCVNLTNNALIELSSGVTFDNLMFLNFSNCPNLDDEGVNFLISSRKLPRLASLLVDNCPLISEKAQNSIREMQLRAAGLISCSNALDNPDSQGQMYDSGQEVHEIKPIAQLSNS